MRWMKGGYRDGVCCLVSVCVEQKTIKGRGLGQISLSCWEMLNPVVPIRILNFLLTSIRAPIQMRIMFQLHTI